MQSRVVYTAKHPDQNADVIVHGKRINAALPARCIGLGYFFPTIEDAREFYGPESKIVAFRAVIEDSKSA